MIGGEFQIAVTDILNAENRHLESPDVYSYSSGRAALYQILKYLKQEKGVTSVFLPDYLCSSILVPIQKLGLEYSFYRYQQGKYRISYRGFRVQYRVRRGRYLLAEPFRR